MGTRVRLDRRSLNKLARVPVQVIGKDKADPAGIYCSEGGERVRKKLAVTVILILGLAIGYGIIVRGTPGIVSNTGFRGAAQPGSVLPPEGAQIAAIKQLNDVFFEVMSEYSGIRQEYLADRREDRDSRFIPRVEALYREISAGRNKLSLFKVSREHQQAMGDAQQNSLYLANSIFEFYDALLTRDDYRRQQLDNSAKDYSKALPYYTSLSVAHQAP